TFIVDPTSLISGELLQQADSFHINNAPTKIGIVFVVNDEKVIDGRNDVGVAIMRAYNFAKSDRGAGRALTFLTRIYKKAGTDEVTVDHVIEQLNKVFPGEDIDDILGEDSDYDDKRMAGKAFFDRTGLGELPQVLLNGVPMKKDEMDPNAFEEAVLTDILQQTTDFQKSVWQGDITDQTDLLDYLMSRPNVMPRLNPRILTPDIKHIDLSSPTGDTDANVYEAFSQLKPGEMSATVANSMKYMTKRDDYSVRPVTNWIVCDLETEQGRLLLRDGIKQMKNSNKVRVGILNNPFREPSDGSHWLARAVNAALQSQTKNNAKNFIVKLLKEENIVEINDGKKTVQDLAVSGMDLAAFNQLFDNKSTGFVKSHQRFCQYILGVVPGGRAIVSNGKLFGPLKQDEEFGLEDFNLLEKYVSGVAAENIQYKMRSLNISRDEIDGLSDLVMKVDALLTANPQTEERKAYDFKASEHSFYRYVLEPEVGFRPDGSFTAGPIAKFNDLPHDILLTLNMMTPEGWLVESVRSPYDLDNIKLSEVESYVYGHFELEYLLLEGHCIDLTTGQPPRGMQFTLGTNNQPVTVDTIVMANLGYFQLKANPGAWLLRLRQGRSADIYEIANHDGTETLTDSDDVVAVMDSFKSKILRIKVQKKPEKMEEDLLVSDDDDEDEDGGIWHSISSSFSSFTGRGGEDNKDSKKKKKSDEDKDQTLNIFSLASGHLYERFLRIMMLTVLKNTKSPVKFWFLKNYLSPTFKEFIPHMATEYGFEYELVQYKWPRWLHQQTEKQRIIWGYKILFLDVLFPLDVQKIIFVDADQIVRTDLQDLADFDLGGAPYGYTPFCDSRKEMNGFRFWRSGYWASHLSGRKYHISALYVVDLKKFRRIAAGDRLRGQYQGLSQDPNSLSNLDQDLPNNMIHQVAIKTLPQEWLWCETWCSDEELKTAKTIDLCNNPLTKEPKLTAAMRIIPEWTDYDNEIKALQDRIANSSVKTKTESSKTKDIHVEL
ncbi:UDP-glucose:glycoprotein glucosyltransferase 1-like, partial [Saccoglossus kowalevskii]|uniref:UDP-glucose:glycoprotein glucosyltransferase 1-like n=1 Tax=Saccoglossus kowalevskii TaxID=10224 RepID=A0ABM0GL84_SACKO